MTILTNADVEEIIKILDGSSYGSLRVTTSAFDLTIRREGDGWVQERATLSKANVIGSSQIATTASERKTAIDADVPGLVSVRSPMVGTFYAASKPGAAPFVEVGAMVETNTTVGIIETMKLMNSIPAGASGKVTEVLVVNGMMVEVGQTLMRLKP